MRAQFLLYLKIAIRNYHWYKFSPMLRFDRSRYFALLHLFLLQNCEKMPSGLPVRGEGGLNTVLFLKVKHILNIDKFALA